MNFDKEFLVKWNVFQQNVGDSFSIIVLIRAGRLITHKIKPKTLNDLHTLIDLILLYFDRYVSIEIHDVINLVAKKDLLSEKLVGYDWPDQIFYFLNEEIANLNRHLVKISHATEDDFSCFKKLVKILQVCLILSKNTKCLDLIINTSIINQFLSSSSHLFKIFKSQDSEVRTYFKCLCFLLIKAQDQNFSWLFQFYNLSLADDVLTSKNQKQYQRQFFYKFDQSFFVFFFESVKMFNGSERSLSTLAIHTYVCALNEYIHYFNSFSNGNANNNSSQNEILLRAITPPMIDYLFKLFYEKETVDTEDENKLIYLNDYIDLVVNRQQPNERQQEILFYDKKLIVCRCIPLLVNILHLSLPDKRQVDLLVVLEKCMIALEEAKRADIKLEIIRSYLSMIDQCTDKAALKIVIVSSRFFTCLLEQMRLVSLTAIRIDSFDFLHEFIKLSLSLIKNLMENSQSVKDTLIRCDCFNSLYEILKGTTVLDKSISILMNLMINEVTLNSKQLKNPEQVILNLDELKNCEMAVLVIRLLPFMQPEAQEFSLNNICRLSTMNSRNQLKSCNNLLLSSIIDLLNFYAKFSMISIEKIFRSIQILGRCSISHTELKKLIELLQPKKQFPYGIHVLRCFVVWSKFTSSIGLNLGFLSIPTNDLNMLLQNENNVESRAKGNAINQSILSNMLRAAGTGALSANAQQQAKYFFDFQFPNSGIIVPAVKKWPGYAFTFHCWIKLRNDLELFEKKRRQLYSFYNDTGQGFEAFFTPDCSSLVVSVCTKKEFLSVQLRELDFDSSQSINSSLETSASDPFLFANSTNSNLNTSNHFESNTTNTSDYWHSIMIVHKPAKGPFSSSQICIYVDGILKKETDFKLPNFSDSFSHIRVGAACSHKNQVFNANYNQSSFKFAAPLTNFKKVFDVYKGNINEKMNLNKILLRKNESYSFYGQINTLARILILQSSVKRKLPALSLNVTTIPSGSQDTVWDPSTCLIGQMSSCFVLHDMITDIQARLIYELGPNQYAINWLDLPELTDLKSKFVFHYDAKCSKDLNCIDLSANKMSGKFSGENFTCNNFRESLNSIGSVQIFYPLLNYLSSNQDYYDLVCNAWSSHSKQTNLNHLNTSQDSSKPKINLPRKSSFDDSEIEQNVVAFILNLFRYLFHSNDLLQDRLERNNGIALLSFLLQRLPRCFIDINLLRMCQEFVSEANSLSNKDLLNNVYEHLVFDFRIWNKADYEIRIGHIQYISTIIKDDKKYFRKKYGIQFFLDVIKTYFGKLNSTATNPGSTSANYQNQHNFDITENGCVSLNQQQLQSHNYTMNDEDLRNLRNSFFGLIKYYAQKEIKINELNAIISFLSTTRNPLFQNDLLDMLISLLEAPTVNDQLILRLFEPNLADSFYALLTQPDVSYQIQTKLLKLIKILLKTKKVYEKNKSRLRLDDCGGYSGLVSKISYEYWFAISNNKQTNKFSELIAIDLLNNFLMEDSGVFPVSYESVWHIISLLTVSATPLITELSVLIDTRSNICKIIIDHSNRNPQAIKLLTKCIAWQDMVCQLLCIEKKHVNIRKSTNEMPEILISSASHNEASLKINQSQDYNEEPIEEEEILVSGEETAEWENLDETSESKIERISLLKKMSQTKSGDSDSMLISTPSTDKHLKSRPPISEWNEDDQNEFDNKLSTKTQTDGKVTSTLLKKAIKNSAGSSVLNNIRKSLVYNGNETEQSSIQTRLENYNNKNNIGNEYLESVEAKMFCESMLDLMFRLLWEGIVGSSEEAWKERCQIFSSMHRLSNEYEFIKPREYFEIKLIEMLLKQCLSDSRKAGSIKETASANENSREVIKLVEFFVIRNNQLTIEMTLMTISLLDQMRAFDQNFSTSISPESSVYYSNPDNFSQSLNDSLDILHLASASNKNTASLNLNLSVATLNVNNTSSNNMHLISSFGGIVHDELTETSYLGMNILTNLIANDDIEICGQAAAKINAILYNRSIYNMEEAGYLIFSVEKVMFERLKDLRYEEHYACLIPLLKNLINKCFHLLQMNVQIPNVPFNNVSATPYEDFKEYCMTNEWRIFIQKQITPLRDQYLAMAINPCQMNMKLWWTLCKDTLMQSVHKRNRQVGESKIKFEDSIFNNWKDREKQETIRYQNFLIHLKRSNLAMRKQLHNSLRFFTSERGSWNEGTKEIYWMLSNHENRERMRCKLIENLQFDSHYEASRLRDYSDYTYFNYENKENIENSTDKNRTENTTDLAQNLQLNKEAINIEINEDNVGVDDEMISNKNHSNSPTGTNLPVQQASSSSITSQSASSLSQVPSQMSIKTVQQEHIEAISQLEEKEKLLEKSECELITVTKTIKGRFELTNKNIYFFDTFSSFYYHETGDNDSNDILNSINQTGFSNNSNAGFNCHDFDILNDFKIPLNQLKEVQIRRYNLRRSALEFFLIDESNYFINFNKNIRDKIYRRLVSMRLPNMQSYLSVRTPADLLKATDYTQRWCNHDMSNFEYLMKLNTIAGRSYNDLTQYPVFPWILKDYVSTELDLNNPEVYRDLSKPVGVLNKKFEDYVRQKYELFEDPTGAMRPFHYGTHYSNSANVMHFLIRLEPFTTLHIQLQSDRFDVADRQFYSIPSTWRVMYDNPNDVKELIPEFFYLPEFLENMNNFDFGELQISKNKVNNVTLPAWAKNPEHFINMHRKALESDFVSEHLNEWIDLIFGYKQQGVDAEKALNVFMYCSYEGAIDLDAITDPVARHATEGMISNFGQTPTQLLKEPHIKRKSREQAIKDKIIQGKPIILWHQITSLKAYYVELCDPKKESELLDPVVYISIPRNHIKSFMQQGLSDPLLSITQQGVIGVNGWQAYERSLTNLFSFEKDPSLLSEKTKKSIAGPFDPNLDVDSKIFVLTHDSKLLISGGHWDNSLRVFSLTKYRNIAQIYQHSNTVTCLALDYTGTLLVSGSMDTTCMIWQIIQEHETSVNLDPKPMHILYGHTDCVTSVDISIELDMIVSASLDGTINIHTIHKGHFVKSICFRNENINKFINLNVKLSNQRQILVYSYSQTNSLNTLNDSTNQTQKNIYELFLYSINGKLISNEKLVNPVQDMIIKDDYCILAVLINQTKTIQPNNSKQNNYVSKIIFKENYDLKTVQVMRLKAPITCLFLTREDSHLLVGLRDGKLIVITGDRQI